MSWIPKYGRMVRRAVAAGGGSPEPQDIHAETPVADETSALEQPVEAEAPADAGPVEVTVQGADVTEVGVAFGPETDEPIPAAEPLPPEPSAEPVIHALDHDGNGTKGGSLPKSKRKPKNSKAE